MRSYNSNEFAAILAAVLNRLDEEGRAAALQGMKDLCDSFDANEPKTIRYVVPEAEQQAWLALMRD